MYRMEIYNDDCFNILPKIKEKSVNMVLVDLPYGQIACEWDVEIDLDKMWNELLRCCKKDCIYVFFCTTKFGYSLIKSNPEFFRYDLVWEKSNSAGFLNSKSAPLRKHEMIYIFSDRNNEDLNISKNKGLREYFKTIHEFIGTTRSEIMKKLGGRVAHCLTYTGIQFSLPTEKTYNDLIAEYKIDSIPNFREYKDLKEEWGNFTYNPQKTKGKPYKRKGTIVKNSVYGDKIIKPFDNKAGDRLPTSILKFNSLYKTVHQTQKPVELCEWLIKTYSNENEIVLDFTMGSGTTGVACKNLNRKFIGIEKDKKIFDTASKRLSSKS